MTQLTDHWAQLSPKARRALTLSAGGAVIAGLAWLMATAPGQHQPGQGERERLVTNLLTDVDPRDLGIDGLGRRLKRLESDVRGIAHNLEKVGLSVADDSSQSRLVQTLRSEREAELKALRTEVRGLREDLQTRLAERADAGVAEPSSVAITDANADAGRFTPPAAGERNPPTLEPTPPPSLDQLFLPPTEPGTAAANTPKTPTRSLNIRHVADADAPPAPSPEEAAEAKIPEVRIPAGSILRGVLLSGLDAPTGRAARQDPYPALLRLKHTAILPNRFRADVRECFLLVGGYGDLGSERVYLRAESINCVRRDGRTLEVAVDGYAVGEDGKVGVRGRLVNKQGQVIGQALQVSFLQGFSQLFSTVPAATVATGTGAVPFQQVFSGAAMQGAMLSGTGEALERLAEYYLDMAENLFPVLEVDAGRGIEVILNRGVGLKLQ
ncbi:conjugal transfer protein TrbI [Lamprobacter modestohalophilus]|uniref:Conjugal transfer protein TrbI n=1 Tax=Lamprobacter modestohalophilus TaxID=1064514 RepID=A0A9X0WE24_9GAMM|nr:TrbI/VirB10 family protein [Lamprobacter modestohalophilus]MBK1621739.1 conjugal transfer protein TrbI [Lamprobacter modestohalophilus]